ncbi:MAG: sulfotransferase [Proteobacteria bacterium]|nr:sulfotransferase [Pseudomonadota bacterium]
MACIKRFIHAAWFEGRLWVSGCTLRKSAPALIPLLVAVGYVAGPWDFIPDHIPYVGHADEAGIATLGVLTARMLLPPEAFAGLLEQMRDGSQPFQPTSLQLLTWLVWHRRLRRTRAHAATRLRRLRSRPHRNARAADRLFDTVGYRRWWQLRSIAAPRVSALSGLVVVGGSPRSGTTLLRTLLSRHSMIAAGPETTVFLNRISSPEDIATRLGWQAAEIRQWQRDSRSQAEFIGRFHAAVVQRFGKPVWLEKTPRNVGRFRFVRRHFPNAKLVHIVRDGRDVVCSLRRTPFARLDHAAPDSTAAAIRCAVQWRKLVEAGIKWRHDPNYYELSYEALVRAPEEQLRALLTFLDLPWEPQILQPADDEAPDIFESKATRAIFDSSPGRWRHELSPADQRALDVLLGPTLAKVGYA